MSDYEAEAKIMIVTCFFSPRDFPDKWVARAFWVVPGLAEPVPAAKPLAVCSSWQALINAIPEISMGMFWLPRTPHDEPQVVGCWI